MNLHSRSRIESAPYPPKCQCAAGAARLRWVVNFGVLLLYALAATPLAPALTALAASLDCSHHVALRCDSHGTRVVLHHECANSPTHVHGAVARALTFFAQRSANGDPDHVIQFHTADSTPRTQALRATPPSGHELLKVPAEPPSLQSIISLVCQCLEPRPPPGVSGLLLSVRTTVLLI